MTQDLPSRVVHKLPQQLNRWLGAVHLFERHVQVVHKDDGALANRWTIHTLRSGDQWVQGSWIVVRVRYTPLSGMFKASAKMMAHLHTGDPCTPGLVVSRQVVYNQTRVSDQV